MKDLIKGFFDSQEFSSVRDTLVMSVIGYIFVALFVGVFNWDTYLLKVVLIYGVIAITLNAVFMWWEYCHDVDMLVQGLESIPVEISSKYHAGAIELVENKMLYHEDTGLCEYNGDTYQSLVMALEVAMYNHPVYKDWDTYAIHSVAKYVVKRYFPDHA